VNTSCLERATALSADFSSIKDWESRYRRVIEQGHALLPLEAHEREGDRYLITGCVSRAWLVPSRQGKQMILRGDSEAAIVKGIIAMLVTVYSGAMPEEVLIFEPQFLHQIGLTEHLSMNRRNGLSQFVKQIKLYAAVYRAQDQVVPASK
jgi:cysteine desulfuration protein SufE